MSEGRREWTIWVCPTCGRLRGIGNVCTGSFNKGAHHEIGFVEKRVAEVGVSPEEEKGKGDSLASARGFQEREALRGAHRALAEVVRYFDSYAVPAGFPLASLVKPAAERAARALEAIDSRGPEPPCGAEAGRQDDELRAGGGADGDEASGAAPSPAVGWPSEPPPAGGLSREEVEALMETDGIISPACESARAKLRAYLGGTDA